MHFQRVKTVEVDRPLELGRLQVVQSRWDGPVDVVGVADKHHLELSMVNASVDGEARFLGKWAPNRYERFGKLFLIPADHGVHIKSRNQEQISIICEFDPQKIQQWFDRDLEWTDLRLQNVLNISSDSVRNRLLQIRQELQSPGFASDALVELMAAQVIIEVARHIIDFDEGRVRGGLSKWCLQRIEERLTENEEAPSLPELADLCNMSVRHLTRAFRVSRGRTLGSYIVEHRINHAKRMLASGMSVKSVAYTVGFSAPSNFSAAFVRATGETPREYRQRAGRQVF